MTPRAPYELLGDLLYLEDIVVGYNFFVLETNKFSKVQLMRLKEGGILKFYARNHTTRCQTIVFHAPNKYERKQEQEQVM